MGTEIERRLALHEYLTEANPAAVCVTTTASAADQAARKHRKGRRQRGRATTTAATDGISTSSPVLSVAPSENPTISTPASPAHAPLIA